MPYYSMKIIVLVIIIALAVLLISVGAFVFFSLRAQKKRNQYALELEQCRIYTEQFREYEKQYTILQEQRHNMKHHIRYIRELIWREEYDKMREYMDCVMKELQ